MGIARDGAGSGKVTYTNLSTLTTTFATNAARHLTVAGAINGTSSISDSVGNTWVKKNNAGAFVFYCENAAAIASFTISTVANAWGHYTLEQWTGVKVGDSFDTQVDASGVAGSPTWNGGNISGAQLGELYVAAGEGDDSTNVSWTSTATGWTQLHSDGDTTSNLATESYYRIENGSQGPFTIGWNYPGMGAGIQGFSTMVAFFPATVAPVPTYDNPNPSHLPAILLELPLQQRAFYDTKGWF